ncbi:MAG: menaquinol oxidoreductase, partial [Deltaproteobacteria bacterium]|nr:menaquinol oxidoreductase [Deltaproteobacteria bacterium]
LILLCFFVRKFTKFDPGKEAIQSLAKIVTYGLLANVFFMACEVFVVFYSKIPEHMDHFKYLYAGVHGHGALVPWMWASVVLMGLGVLFLLNPSTRRNEKILPWTCVMVFIGTWIDKGLGMISGGFVPSPLHHYTEYIPTSKELIITLGVYAAGALVLTILMKIAVTVKEEVSA